MSDSIRMVDCYYATVTDRPGEACRLLEHISEIGMSLTAFTAIPAGDDVTQICLVTETPDRLDRAAAEAGTELVGPKPGFLIRGEDRVGALHEAHLALANAGVNVYASGGLTDEGGRFAFMMWVEPGDVEKAIEAFGLAARAADA